MNCAECGRERTFSEAMSLPNDLCIDCDMRGDDGGRAFLWTVGFMFAVVIACFCYFGAA